MKTQNIRIPAILRTNLVLNAYYINTGPLELSQNEVDKQFLTFELHEKFKYKDVNYVISFLRQLLDCKLNDEQIKYEANYVYAYQIVLKSEVSDGRSHYGHSDLVSRMDICLTNKIFFCGSEVPGFKNIIYLNEFIEVKLNKGDEFIPIYNSF